MIEVDVFWSFSIGASLAACAWRQLQHTEDPFANRYFVYAVLFLSCVFAPSGAYLLFAFPGWETMYFMDITTLTRHPMLPTLFALTNTLNGVIGFYSAWRCIRSGNALRAHTLWTTSYVCMFTILGLGYARFLYAGDAADWAANKPYALTDWFVPRADSVFVALLVMGVPILPGLWVPMWVWAGGCTAREKQRIVQHIVGHTVKCVLAVVVAYAVWVIAFASPEVVAYLKTPPVGPFSFFAPAVGVVVANAVFMCVAFWPLAFMPTAEPIEAAVAPAPASASASAADKDKRS